jgi:small subunit ribosomal protein S6
MPANVYECMFLLDTNKMGGDQAAAAKQLHGILERNQAEVLASRPWDERKLAYPVKGHKKGLYYLTYFRTEGKNLANIERDFALNETILRALVLHVDPKLVDIMLTLARDEHPVALQTVHDQPEDAAGGGRPEGDGERGRRSPRRGPDGRPPEGRAPEGAKEG